MGSEVGRFEVFRMLIRNVFLEGVMRGPGHVSGAGFCLGVNLELI